jgi:hypothetical protein
LLMMRTSKDMLERYNGPAAAGADGEGAAAATVAVAAALSWFARCL